MPDDLIARLRRAAESGGPVRLAAHDCHRLARAFEGLARERDEARAEADRLRRERDAITELCWYPAELDDGRWVNRLNLRNPEPDDDHDFAEDDKAGIIAAVRRAAGLGPGPGEGEGASRE